MRSLGVWLVVALLSAACWIVCETLGGLAFLGAGVRLWRYHMAPLFWDITSPVIWVIVFLVMPPFMIAFARIEERRRFRGVRRLTYRVLLLVIVGPVVEVLINELVFKAHLGGPLYTYTVLPTFGGSGSLLSPFYYFTLYIHYPLTDTFVRWLVPAAVSTA